MKRSHRVGAICQILTESPGKIFSLSFFCEKFSAAKSSISEDMSAAKEAVAAAGYGYIETIPGAAGGVRYVPDISDEKAHEVLNSLCDLLQERNRILGGGFLYTSDIMYNPVIVQGMAQIFARRFRNSSRLCRHHRNQGDPPRFRHGQTSRSATHRHKTRHQDIRRSDRKHQLLPGFLRKTAENVSFQTCRGTVL